jgi:CTP synthase
MAGLEEAGHREIDPNTPVPLLVIAACPVDNRPAGTPRLSGKLKIELNRDSLAFRIYRKTVTAEPFTCNYELNPDYRGKLEAAGMRVSGVSADGGARIIELPDHRFFIGTGFVPQLSSEANKPHPLIVAYLKAAIDSKKGTTKQ